MNNPSQGHSAAVNRLPWLLALLMAYIVYAGAPWGPALTPDSMYYVHSVGLLVDGWRVTQLPSQWPPGFPLALAAGKLAFGDLATAARLLQAAAGAASVLMFVRVLENCEIDRSLACLFVVLLIVQPGFVDPHLMMWSEPLFLTLALLDLLLLGYALGDLERSRGQVWLGLACGAATMVRYAGLSLVVVNALAILLLARRQQDRHRRWFAATATTIVALLPFVTWTAFNHFRGQSTTNRSFAWHPPGSHHLAELTHTAASWFQLPSRFGFLLVLLIVVAAVVNLVISRAESTKGSDMRAILSIYLLAYAGFLWLAISAMDYATPLDERILSPIFPACLAVPALLLKRYADRFRGPVLLLAVPLAILFGVGGYTGWRHWRSSRSEGVSLSSRAIREMPVLAWLRDTPGRLSVLSNGPELFELYLQRDARALPSKVLPMSSPPAPGYRNSLAANLSRTDLVVYFYPMAWRSYLPTPEELDQVKGLHRIYSGRDAVVWTTNATAFRYGSDQR